MRGLEGIERRVESAGLELALERDPGGKMSSELV